VPAAAVIRKRQALFVINGSKGYVGGIVNLIVTRKSGFDNIVLEFKRSNKYAEWSVLIRGYSEDCEVAKACYYNRLTLRYEGMGIDRD
jgi:hypothetical protein